MSSDPRQLPLCPITTLAAWLICLAAGVLGLTIPYPGPTVEPAAVTFPATQLVDAQLTPEAAPPPEPVAPNRPPEQVVSPTTPPAPAPEPPALPDNPPLVAVAPASPAIAFALPTEGLTRVVEPAKASYARVSAPATNAVSRGTGTAASAPAPPPPKPAPPAPPAPVVARLTLGEGEGRRIHPAYPREAVLAQQQGNVGIRCTVEEDGHVSAAQVTVPSHWPALNQEALRAVRETLFAPGPRRIYDVPIEFHLDR